MLRFPASDFAYGRAVPSRSITHPTWMRLPAGVHHLRRERRRLLEPHAGVQHELNEQPRIRPAGKQLVENLQATGMQGMDVLAVWYAAAMLTG